MALDQKAQQIEWLLDRARLALRCRNDPFEPVRRHSGYQRILVLEVEVERAFGDTDAGSDVGHSRAHVAPLPEHRMRAGEDFGAAAAASGRFAVGR